MEPDAGFAAGAVFFSAVAAFAGTAGFAGDFAVGFTGDFDMAAI
jgi:hypothetical protein